MSQEMPHSQPQHSEADEKERAHEREEQAKFHGMFKDMMYRVG